MSIVEQLLKKTESLHTHLKKGIPDTNRDEYIERISALIDERETLISNLPASYTEHERQLGAQIVSLNKEIDALLKKQANHLKRELDQFNQKKRLSQQYANPYARVTIDGMFLDKKK